MRLSHSIRNTFLMLRRLFAAALLVRIGRGACGRRLRGHRFPHRPLCRVLQDAPLPLVGAPDLTRTLFGSASPGEKAPRFRMMAMLAEFHTGHCPVGGLWISGPQAACQMHALAALLQFIRNLEEREPVLRAPFLIVPRRRRRRRVTSVTGSCRRRRQRPTPDKSSNDGADPYRLHATPTPPNCGGAVIWDVETNRLVPTRRPAAPGNTEPL